MGFVPTPMLGLYPGYQEVLGDCAFADAAAEYIGLQDRIRRAIDTGKLGDRITPAGYPSLYLRNSNLLSRRETKSPIGKRAVTIWLNNIKRADYVDELASQWNNVRLGGSEPI
jgi:hypothetical protein